MAVCGAVRSDLEKDNRSIVWAGLGWAGLDWTCELLSSQHGFYSMESVNVVSVISEDLHLILPEEGGKYVPLKYQTARRHTVDRSSFHTAVRNSHLTSDLCFVL